MYQKAQRDDGRRALERQARKWEADSEALWQALYESRTENEELRTAVVALSGEVKLLGERIDDNAAAASSRQSALSGEVQAVACEVVALRSRAAACESGLEAVRGELQRDGTGRDLAIVRSEQSCLSSASARLEKGVAEHSRLLSDVRAELAGLAQRHAALNASGASEQAAAQQVASSLRSAVDELALKLDSLAARVAAFGTGDAFLRSNEKLKRAAKRHELMLTALSEAHEASRTELRSLIRELAAQLLPVQQATQAHGEQLDDCCAAINLFAEAIRPSHGEAAAAAAAAAASGGGHSGGAARGGRSDREARGGSARRRSRPSASGAYSQMLHAFRSEAAGGE